MRSLAVRLLFSFLVLTIVPCAFAHDVTLSGTSPFGALDGSPADHDGAANGVFTVNDGSLVIDGVVNCNDDGTEGACSMTFQVSGNLSVRPGGALYAENRTGSGMGGAITLNVGGNLSLDGNAVVSTASKSSSGSTGGAITANVGGSVAVAAGATIDSGSSNAAGGAIVLAAGGAVGVNGNVLSGPSRTFLATRLSGGAALGGGTSNNVGGAITISSSTFAEPAVVIGSAASIVSQGADNGAGPVTIDGCGVQVYGLVAALARKAGAATVRIRSGKDLLVDGRDLGATGTRMGRIRADAPTGTGAGKGVDLFAAGTIDIYGPASGLYAITALPGLHDSKSYGGLIRITSLGDAVNASGNVIDDGHSASGDTGGTVEIAAKGDVNLDLAVIAAIGDFNTNNPNRGGGAIRVRSYSGDVIWTNGIGEVRPVGSTSNLAIADQGSIVLTACGTVDTTGSTFPVMGTATSMFPETHTGVCSPAAPSLPPGVPPLVACNTPPAADEVAATTNEDTTVTITLSGSDVDGDSLTFTILTGPANGTLGAVIATGPTTATVDYTPNADFNGSDSLVFQASDGNGGTDSATATITVNAVNDAPSFLAGPTVLLLEDAGAQSYANWASSISAGPADESSQTVTFVVTNDNNALFAVQPSVDSTGTLTFTPAADAFGSATLTITAQDDGGTANGGVDTSASQNSAVTVTGVNDEPSFVAGASQSVNEDAGPQSVPNWATAISAGPNEGSQSVSFVVTSDNDALFSTRPAVDASGNLTYTPAADAHGTATVSIYAQDDGGTANGGDDTSPAVTFTVAVNAVNDAPSFVSGGDVTVLEDSGAYSAAWATSISAGPGNESSQTLSFNLTGNSNPSLFASGPSISPTGVLAFTLASDANGSATLTVTLSDDGGTANGGADTSAAQAFTITVNDVNDAPSFVSGGNVSVSEDSGAYAAGWATSITAGPGESGQTVALIASNDNNALFSLQPSIDAAGVLTFTPAPNAFGSATVSVFAQDNGGTANGGVDTGATITFTILVSSVNDPPFAANDTWETEGNTELRVDNIPSILPYVGDTTSSGKGVLDNDGDPVEGSPVLVTGIVGCADTTAPFDCAVAGGTVSLADTGYFSFKPAPAATSGGFQYTISDGTDTATAAVTITIHDMIWYVNGSAPAGGDGTSTSPFNNLGALNGAGDVDGAGDYIFVQSSAVSGSIVLEAGQKFWGQGIGLVIPRNLNGNGFPTTVAPAFTRPDVDALSGDTVIINDVTGVEVAGLSLGTNSGDGIDITSAAAPTSASIYATDVTSMGGEGIDINAGNAVSTSVSISDSSVLAIGDGIDLLATDGNVVFSFGNGAVTSLGGSGIVLDGSAADSLVVTGMSNVTIGAGTALQGVSINRARFDANIGTAASDVVSAGTWVVATSASPVGGVAVALNNVSGDLAFGSLNAFGSTGGVTIAGAGLFTGLAGMRVTSGGGAISGASGTGLSVTNSTIGAANLAFTSISSNGGTNGVVLNNTGTEGGLAVLGSGIAASGGTIQNTTSHGISLTNTKEPSFAWLHVANSGAHGINATSVSGLTLTNCQIANSGNGDNEYGMRLSNVSGAVVINGTTFDHAAEDLVNVDNSNTNMSLTVGSNSQFQHGAVPGPFAGNGIVMTARGTTAYTVNVSNSAFTNVALSALQVGGDGTSVGAQVVDVNGNQFTVTTPGRSCNVSIQPRNSSTADVEIVGNVMNGVGGGAVNIGADESTNVAAKVNNNTISNTVAAGILAANDDNSFLRIEADGNQLSNIGSDAIEIVNFGGTGISELDAVVTNNIVNGHNTNPGTAFIAGIALFGFEDSACVVLRGNAVSGTTPAFFDYSLEEVGGTMTLEEIPDTPATTASDTYILSINSGSSGTVDLVGIIDLTNGLSCDRP